MSEEKLDSLTDELLSTHRGLPSALRFDEKTWLQEGFAMPPWPIPMLPVLHASKVHNLVTLLNRRKQGEKRRRYLTVSGEEVWATGPERVLMSARIVLKCQEFIHKYLREGMLCWTQNQQSFNAAVSLNITYRVS